MLQLQHVVKTYSAGDTAVTALRGVDMAFRHNEFVSILGPSGCGKTTLLNIVGGLDHYSAGDLIINGKSTRDFKDRDWDTYRNHTIGFVFQSYHLIPHQTVLQNVELALTLSGVPRKERRRRAKEALEQVGLGNQLRKRPGEMSGGQMQRVAIARALVNNPDIILADEPTGALDTETSVQVMEILKEVAKDRLVIMVTHNPDLAERYSTRIIRMLDGQITGDTAPMSEQEIAAEQAVEQEKLAAESKKKKPSMSFATSFGLSLKNLFTKKGRTALTSFAGSIGIIGIALIFSVSQGTTSYISAVQEDTLASYPLTLEQTHMDMGALLQTFIGSAQSSNEHDRDAVYQKSMIYDMINSFNQVQEDENDLRSFKQYLEERRRDENDSTGLREALNGIQYSYNLNLLVYTVSPDNDIILSDSSTLMRDLIAEYMGSSAANKTDTQSTAANYSIMFSSSAASSYHLWQEMLSGDDNDPINPLLKKQYDMVYGKWPTAYNEIVLVLDEHNELDDLALYSLGLKNREDIDAIMDAAVNGTTLESKEHTWSYAEITEQEYRVVLNSDCYIYDEAKDIYTDLRDTETGMKYVYDNGIPLKVTGIIRPNEDASSAMLSGSIGYTAALTQEVIRRAEASAAVQAQLEDPETDIFTALPFKDEDSHLTDEQKQERFLSRLQAMDTTEKAVTYAKIVSIPSSEQLNAAVEQGIAGKTRPEMEQMLLQAMSQQTGMDTDNLSSYLAGMSDEDISTTFRKIVEEQVKAQFAAAAMQQIAGMQPQQLATALDAASAGYTAAQCAVYYDEVLEFSDASYEDNLAKLGHIDLDSPVAINLFASSFANKDTIKDAIESYNQSVDEIKQIAYTDYVGLMMSSVTTIINAITYVLIAFVAISLIVSSIMIGVITLISVQERTKEIGILRAIGASKKDVSGMFNAETVIIGFTSGLLGVLITYLLCIPINLIIHALTGIDSLNAFLPVNAAVILVVISMLLTLISGIIPSRSAAKKDPVVALRTE